MLESRTTRIVLGAAIWIGAATAFCLSGPAQALPHQAGRLAGWAVRGPLEVRISCPQGTGKLRLHDPIFEERADGEVRQVGEIVSFQADRGDGVPEALAIIYSTERDRLAAETRFQVALSSGSPRWIIETLLPDEERQAIIDEIEGFLAENEDLLLETAALIGDELLAEGKSNLEENFAEVVRRHEDELAAALEKHGASWNAKIVPVLQKKVWPVAREKTQPILQVCIEEMWDQLPVTATVWGALKSRVKESVGVDEVDPAWRTDLVKLIVDTLEAHGDEFQAAIVETAKEASQDADVRAAVGETAAAALSDPEVLIVLKDIFRDAVTTPFQTRDFIRRMMEDARVKSRIAKLERSLEPRLFKIAQIITLAEDGRSIDPDLARVLRRTIFNKDRRLLMVHFGDDALGEGEAVKPVDAGHLFRAGLAGASDRADARPRTRTEQW